MKGEKELSYLYPASGECSFLLKKLCGWRWDLTRFEGNRDKKRCVVFAQFSPHF